MKRRETGSKEERGGDKIEKSKNTTSRIGKSLQELIKPQKEQTKHPRGGQEGLWWGREERERRGSRKDEEERLEDAKREGGKER